MFGPLNFLSPLLGSGDFMPHGHCYLWEPGLVWLHSSSDLIIGLAYTSIPVTLCYFVKRRQDIPFSWMFLAFGTFITACGLTHFMEVWNIWHADYWLAGAIKAVTAIASIVTAVLLVRLMPHALAIPSPERLAEMNKRLTAEIEERKQADAALKQVRAELESRVQERTRELEDANRALNREIAERRRIEGAQQRSEMQLSNIIGSAMDAIITVDCTQKVILFNSAAEKMFGVAAQEAIGKQIDDFIPERFRTSHRRHIDRFGEAHVTKRSMGSLGAIFGVRSDGTEFPIEASISQVEVGGEKLYTVILRDITERVRADESLRSSLREKELLLKEVHHRVKNNMQLISSLLSLQAEQSKDPRLRGLVEQSQSRIRSMVLVHERLYQTKDLATIEFGEYLRDIASNVIRSSSMGNASIELELDVSNISLGIDSAIPLGLIVNELVLNAAKHAFPSGSGRLMVSFHQAPTDGGKVEYLLRVADNGVGLPPGFDFRHSQSLGLQIVMTLVDELGGSAVFTNNPAGGAAAEVTFSERTYKSRIQ